MKNTENINVLEQENQVELTEIESVTCPHCNEKVEVKPSKPPRTFGWWILGFFLPIVAILLYFYKEGAKDDVRFTTMARGAFICTIILAAVVILGGYGTAIFFALSFLLF